MNVNEPAAFQLSMTASTSLDFSTLPITSLALHFTEDDAPLLVRHKPSDSSSEVVRRIELGHISIHGKKEEVESDLRWGLGAKIIFTGTLASAIPMSMKVLFLF